MAQVVRRDHCTGTRERAGTGERPGTWNWNWTWTQTGTGAGQWGGAVFVVLGRGTVQRTSSLIHRGGGQGCPDSLGSSLRTPFILDTFPAIAGAP